jgi:predicted DNA repair protein MutK
VLPLLMIGGAFLCFEGFEKLAHRFLHSPAEDAAHHAALVQGVSDPAVDLVALEKQKIKGAVRTDFILSAEIIVITLGTVAAVSFTTRVAVLVGIALIMTVGVYGLVAGIVKLDDFGLYLSRKTGDAPTDRMLRGVGAAILAAAPWLMKALSVAGTAAMFLVGGGIIVHGIPPLHHAIERLGETSAAFGWLFTLLADAVVGIAVGALVLAVVSGAQRLWRPRTA